MTVKEALELQRQLQLVFPVVRLVDPGKTTVWNIDETGALIPAECCFAFWGKRCRCENCTSMRADERRCTVDKYEILDREAYHVTSRWLEIDGRNFVLEIVSKFEDKNRLFLLEDEERARRHVIESLTDDFECVIYVNLNAPDEESALTAYRVSDRLAKAIPGWKEARSFRTKMHLAADHAVIPDDRELFLTETDLPEICAQLEKEDIFYVDFRMTLGDEVSDYQMKFHADRDEFGLLTGFVAGCHCIATETQNSISYKKSAVDSVKDILPLAFWFEDLKEDGRIRAIHYSDEMREMLGYTREEFPDTLETLVEHIHPDDRQTMLSAAIAAGTGTTDGYDVEYRILRADGTYLWANATGKRILNKNGVPEGMYGAFIDISDRKIKERDAEIIDVLTSEYTSVYLINLKTGELTPYSMNETTESEFGRIFRSGIRYTEAYRMYVDSLVLAEDRAKMLQAGTVGNIMRELRGKKSFITVYRDAEGKYCEMKFVKVGDRPGVSESVALGFSEKDDELRVSEEAAKRLHRNLDIIGILASEYTSVYYIDLTTDELDTYTMNEETENEFGLIFRAGIKYSAAFKMYVESLVYPEDRARMLRAGSLYNILDELSSRKTFVTRFRSVSGRYCEMKFVKVGEEEFPQAVALGFSDRDDEIRGEIRRERAQRVFSDLVEDFACVNYIDLSADSSANTTPYRTSEELKRLIPGWEKELNFDRRLHLLEALVTEDERARFLTETEKTNVLRCLEAAPAYYARFHASVEGGIREYEFKFTADRDDSGTLRGVVAGLHRLAD